MICRNCQHDIQKSQWQADANNNKPYGHIILRENKTGWSTDWAQDCYRCECKKPEPIGGVK